MASHALGPVARLAERLGRTTVRGVEEFGFAAALLGESAYWIGVGRWRRQPVRIESVFQQMMEIGIRAIPVVSILSATIGAMITTSSRRRKRGA